MSRRALLLLTTTMLSTAAAEPVFTESVVHDTTRSVEIDLNASTVLCSSADYGALFLKILIPELAGMTLLDHQNTGAGAPCVAAGACQPGRMPADIIDPANPTETVSINVKAVRLDEADSAAQTCSTTLIERVNVLIRGFQFQHERSVALGSRPFSDCGAAATTTPDPTDPGQEPTEEPTDNPADNPNTNEPPAKTGGCSTSGGSGGALLAAMLLGIVLRRRRR